MNERDQLGKEFLAVLIANTKMYIYTNGRVDYNEYCLHITNMTSNRYATKKTDGGTFASLQHPRQKSRLNQ